MASCYEAMSGQAWREELTSFLPHALHCVDPNCLLPLCVNLKLTLRHVQGCKKVDKCTICQGMKSLAASHSNSCRDYYCRVPFCMEAKVTTQQQILMDELGKAFDAGSDSQEDTSSRQLQETSEEFRRGDASRKDSDPRGLPVRNSALPTSVEPKNGPGGEGTAEQVPSSEASCLQPATKISTQDPVSVESIQPELKERSSFKSTVQHQKRSQPSHQVQGRSSVNNEQKYIPTGWLERSPSVAKLHPVTRQPQPGTKRKLQSFIFTDKSTPPAKVARTGSVKLNSQKDDGPEIEIIEIKSSGRLACQGEGTATPSNAVFLPRVPLRKADKKQNEKASTMSQPKHFIKRSTLPKASSIMPIAGFQVPKAPLKSQYTLSDSSHLDFRPVCQGEGQVTTDSADDYLEEMFSTPPPSPTFEMWLGETVTGSNDNSAALKVVLLETLFQLLGVVTQPKTEKQEAVFVDLLERTLRVMKTEIAK